VETRPSEAFDLASAGRSDAVRFCKWAILGSKHAGWDFGEEQASVQLLAVHVPTTASARTGRSDDAAATSSTASVRTTTAGITRCLYPAAAGDAKPKQLRGAAAGWQLEASVPCPHRFTRSVQQISRRTR